MVALLGRLAFITIISSVSLPNVLVAASLYRESVRANQTSNEAREQQGAYSADQAPPQTRPRRVNPAEPGAQPSPVTGHERAGKSKQPSAPRAGSATPKSNSGRDPKKGTAISYTVQVGAFVQSGNAHRLAQSLSQKGYSAQVVTRSDSRGKKWHCVRVGSYPDQDQARKTATEMEGKLKLKAIVRPSISL
jgi:cell division protein FtsN